MRIASLVPSATEALFALGFGDDVVAVTHECDWPAAATELPQLTTSVIPTGLPPIEIDAHVRELTAAGEAIYTLDEERLAALDVDLIVTQALCAVCAVSYDEVCEVARNLPSGPAVVSLDPTTLDEVFDNMVTLGRACGEESRGVTLSGELQSRVDRVADAVAGAGHPAVLALEWLDPPFIGGHWVPEMIRLAGGRDPLGRPAAKSRTATWDELEVAGAELVVVMPCGLYAVEAAEQARAYSEQLARLGAGRVVAVDAASSFSRPGPRLVDGVELLGHLVHPDLVSAPAELEWLELEPVA